MIMAEKYTERKRRIYPMQNSSSTTNISKRVPEEFIDLSSDDSDGYNTTDVANLVSPKNTCMYALIK